MAKEIIMLDGIIDADSGTAIELFEQKTTRASSTRQDSRYKSLIDKLITLTAAKHAVQLNKKDSEGNYLYGWNEEDRKPGDHDKKDLKIDANYVNESNVRNVLIALRAKFHSVEVEKCYTVAFDGAKNPYLMRVKSADDWNAIKDAEIQAYDAKLAQLREQRKAAKETAKAAADETPAINDAPRKNENA